MSEQVLPTPDSCRKSESLTGDICYSFILQRKQDCMLLNEPLFENSLLVLDHATSVMILCARLRLQLCLCPRPSPINLPFWAFIVFRSSLYGALLRIKQVELIDTKSKQTFPFLVIITSWFWGEPGRIDQRASENTHSYCMCTFNKYNTMSHPNVLEAAGAPLKHNHLNLMLVWPRHQSRSLILSRSDPNTHQSLFNCHQRCIYM